MSEAQTAHNTRYYFWLFVIIHTLIWTLGPALMRPTLPHDTLEGITWGLQWQLGYSKHPFLTAWLCAGVTQLFGTVGWPVYLLAQVAVSLTFVASWQLAKKIMPPTHALIAALALEGVLFYNINSFNLTPDTLQSPLWALLALFFYKALTTQKISNWFFTALFAALAVCTKYQAVVILIPMLLLCLINSQARGSFTKPGVYLAIGLFLALIAPHLVWLYQHHFITLSYAETASAAYTQEKTYLSHLVYPLRFFINYIIAVAGLFLLLWPFYFRAKSKIEIESFNWQFLLMIGLGPAFLSLLICMLTGDYFPPRWATPYFFALGIIVIGFLKPALSARQLKQFAVTLIIFSSLLFTIRMVTLSLYPRVESDAFLPNKKIAVELSKLWHEQYHSPLPFIAGSNYLVALVTPYLPDSPKPYLSWSNQSSPWINEQELHEKGAIFIWDEGQNYTWDADSWSHTHLSEAVLHRFPELKILPHYTFYRNVDQHPIIIGVALLPPKTKL